MKFSARLERTFGWIAVPNLTLYIIIGQVLVWLLQNLARYDMGAIALVPEYVAQGQVWRLFTFIFFPPTDNVVFLLFAWLILFMTGNALENYWGSFKYTCYVLLGFALTMLAAVAAYFMYPQFAIPNLFITTSIFLAFAFVNPNYEFLIFFVLPVKVKWLAILALAQFAYMFITNPFLIKIVILAGIGNYFIYFGKDMVQMMKGAKDRREHRARHSTTQSSADEPFHVCSVCGTDDIKEPNLQFFYSDGKGICERCLAKEEAKANNQE